MQVIFSDEERQVMIRLLDEELGELRSGARRTHNPEWHDGLKEDEAVLRTLIGKLRSD